MNNDPAAPYLPPENLSPPRRRRSRRFPCPHCGAMIPKKEHRCTHCGQEIVRHLWPAIWAGVIFLGFLLFCASLYVASLWLRH